MVYEIHLSLAHLPCSAVHQATGYKPTVTTTVL